MAGENERKPSSSVASSGSLQQQVFKDLYWARLVWVFLYLFTGRLCLIGTILDIINHKQLTFEYNQQMALDAMAMVR
jgi:hypothetical protein